MNIEELDRRLRKIEEASIYGAVDKRVCNVTLRDLCHDMLAALKEAQERLDKVGAWATFAEENARLRAAIKEATNVTFPKSQRDYVNRVMSPLRRALSAVPDKG